MAVPSQEEMVRRWEEGMKSGSAKRRYSEAMKNLKENPMHAAAAAKSDYLAGVEKNADHWQRRLMDADFEAMKQTASTTGAERLTSGAVKALTKYKRRIGQIHQGYTDAANAAKEARRSGATMGQIVEAAVAALKRAAGKA